VSPLLLYKIPNVYSLPKLMFEVLVATCGHRGQ